MPTAQEQTTAKIPQRVIWLALAGAVGGFLFGFDSSVVNGAVDAIKDEFALQRGRHRLRRGRRPARLRRRRLPRRPRRRPLRPHPRHEARRRALPGQRHRHRLRVRRLGPDLLAARRRPGHRHGIGHRARLHLRDLPAARPRPARLAAAARHHHRHLRRPAVRRPVRHHRRRRGPDALARPRGLALDVPRRRCPRRRLRLDRLHAPGVPALPGLKGKEDEARKVFDSIAPARTPTATSANPGRHRRDKSPARRALSAARRSACRPWSGSASSSPSCSSSWAST